MNIKQLRIFATVYELRSITRAAERLFVSQPAISKAVAALEAEIGYELFLREGSGLQPTPEANLLIEDISEVLHGFDQLAMSFKRAGRGDRGVVRIAATPGPSLGFLPRLAAEFQESHPRVSIAMKIRNSASIREMVATGNADIGIADTGLQSPRYDSQPHRMICQCALHRSHPAASLAVVGPADLAGTNWITFGPEHEIFHHLVAAHQDAGVQFRSILTVDSSVQAALLVELGSGAAMLDPLTISFLTVEQNQRFLNIVLKPFTPVIHESIDIISVNSRPLSSAARAFLAELKQALPGQPT
jgi:DNA-binding transcriptional LysR family regulator